MTRAFLTIFLTLLISAAQSASAQTYTVAGDVLFYGDNTEFANPFSRGDTVMGAAARASLDIDLNDAVRIRAGLFGSGRFGSHEFVEQGEPLIALEITSGPSRFIFGSLDTFATHLDIAGPDLETPHGLLPPLQLETLTFTRGQEMGLQWLSSTDRVSQDAWINWQRLNTSEHRERFDAGTRTSYRVAESVQLHGQWHLVHEGGQQFASGAVSDSQGLAFGAEWTRTSPRWRLSLDGHAVATYNVPDREQPDLSQLGIGGFTRAAWTYDDWRTHLIVWRSRDTTKAEGDPNYLALPLNGRPFRKMRDYAELGVTRHFRLAPGMHMFAAVRVHRIESQYEYSYRIVGRVRLRHRL